MSLYECVVYDEYRRRKKINLELESIDEVNNYAIDNKLSIVKIKLKSINNKKLKDKQLKLICKKMSILLESGCDIINILEILKKQSNKNIKYIFKEITNHIQKGNNISESFQETKSFSNFFISMIQAGEISGNLDKVMNNLYEYYDKEHKMKTKITTILIYPVILVLLAMFSMTFMIFFIIPNFQMIFENNNIDTPMITTILIKSSEFIRKNYLILNLFLLISLLIVIRFIKYNFKLRMKLNELKLKIPILKDINKLIITNKFCRTFGILMQSGIQVLESISISTRVIDNDYISSKLLITEECIKRGNNISESLEKSTIFPDLFLSMISIGEESGRLDSSIKTITNFYENELDTKIEKSIKILEPMITLIIGLLVGLFAILMVLPMFDAMVVI